MGVEAIYNSHLLPPQPWEYDLANRTGFTLSSLRFAFAFFSSIPVAIIFRRIPNATGKPHIRLLLVFKYLFQTLRLSQHLGCLLILFHTFVARHVYAMITGFLLVYYPFGNGCAHALITASVTYFFMLRFRKHCSTLTWVVVFPYLIANHIAQSSGTAWKEGNLDFTGAQMVLTLKLVAIAICYQDGARDNDAELRDYAKSKQLKTLPSPLEFLSYLFAVGNLLSGPFFEARDYFDYVERKGDWEEGDGTDPRRRIPSAFIPGTYRFLKALFCAAIWQYFTRKGITVDLLESKTWQENHPLHIRIALLWAAVVVFRFKYYFVWGVSEASLVFSGMGFKKYTADGKPLWNRYITSHIRGVEFNPSLADTPRHWNICTGLWLRHCKFKSSYYLSVY